MVCNKKLSLQIYNLVLNAHYRSLIAAGVGNHPHFSATNETLLVTPAIRMYHYELF